MNWDISLGTARQLSGKVIQALGNRLESRKMILAGERLEYAGRLQARYGALKHQAQWHWPTVPVRASIKASRGVEQST